MRNPFSRRGFLGSLLGGAVAAVVPKTAEAIPVPHPKPPEVPQAEVVHNSAIDGVVELECTCSDFHDTGFTITAGQDFTMTPGDDGYWVVR